MGILQEGGNNNGGPTIPQRLDKLNSALQKRASEAEVPVGPIKIEGAGNDPSDQLAAIKQQYDGLVDRLAIPPAELPDSTE